MLSNLNPDTYDLACIQEPYLNPVNLANASNLRRHWDVIYPTRHHDGAERTQSILLVNKKLSKNNWHIIPLDSLNVTAIELTGNFGKVRVYNIYNPCDHNCTIHFLERHMTTENQKRTNRSPNGAASEPLTNIIWLGDFNRHHPMWEMTSNDHLFTAANLNAVDTLIELLAAYNLVQALPPSIATLEASNTKNHTRPDNVFCSAEIIDMFTQCSVEYQLRPVITDHFPIISTLDLSPERTAPILKFNYRETDWKKFREKLTTKLKSNPQPQEISTQAQFEDAYTRLINAIAETAKEVVPIAKQSPYAKRWWTKDLDMERKHVKKLGHKARRKLSHRSDPIHEELRIARNQLSEHIKNAKKDHWEEWLETLTLTGTWDFHRYASSCPDDQFHTRITTLQDPEAKASDPKNATQDNARKSELLYGTFFRQQPENDYVDPNANYPPPICSFENITDAQIYRAIAKLSPFKAPGPNGVCNCVFTKCADTLIPFMGPIFRATFMLGIYPEEWKKSSTIVL